jgi:hypothetical protein
MTRARFAELQLVRYRVLAIVTFTEGIPDAPAAFNGSYRGDKFMRLLPLFQSSRKRSRGCRLPKTTEFLLVKLE